MKTNEFIRVDENSATADALKSWLSTSAIGRAWGPSRIGKAWGQLIGPNQEREARDIVIATERALSKAFSDWALKLQNSFKSNMSLIDINAVPSPDIISGSSIGSQYQKAFSISESLNFSKLNYKKFDSLIESKIQEQVAKVSPANWMKERLEEMTASLNKPSNFNVMLNDLCLKFDAAIKYLYKTPNAKLNFIDDVYGDKAEQARSSSNFEQAINAPIRQIFDWVYDIMSRQTRDRYKNIIPPQQEKQEQQPETTQVQPAAQSAQPATPTSGQRKSVKYPAGGPSRRPLRIPKK